MAKKTLTLSFDGRTVRLLVAKGGSPIRWEAVDLPREQMDQGFISHPQAVAAELSRWVQSERAPKRKVVTSVTGHRAVSRVLTLPKIKSTQLEEAVRRKAKQELPLPLDETYLSWQLLSQEGEGVRVYAFAIPRQAIDGQVQAMLAAKLRPRAMEIKPLALVRVVGLPNAIIVNLEPQSTVVVVVRDGLPLILRSVPQADDGLELSTRIERLSQELARTIRFYNESHSDQPLDTGTLLYATGGLLEEQEARDLLAERSQFQVELPRPAIDLPHDFRLATYSVNLGLMLKRV